MKYPLKRYWIQITLLICCIVVITYLVSANQIKPEIFVGVLAASITAFISSMTHFNNTDKLFKELFTEFNSRYDSMNEFLNSVNSDTGEILGKDKQLVIDYFILCAEEYLWVKKGRIPIDIWENWRAGIIEHLSKPAIRAIYTEESRQNSYYGFFDELNKFLSHADSIVP